VTLFSVLISCAGTVCVLLPSQGLRGVVDFGMAAAQQQQQQHGGMEVPMHLQPMGLQVRFEPK
jgi:hypothetical protein